VYAIELLFKVNGKFEFTNLECKIEEGSGTFDACILKSVNRTYKFATVKFYPAKLLHNIKVNMVFLKRLNGYKPFLYNYTVDACKFLRNPKLGNKVAFFFYGLFAPYSNINHSCPYENIIVDKLPISHLNYQLTKVLPFPEGDYKVESYWMTNDKWVANIFIYFRLF
ncbi:hypothetical protein KR044_003808, partial [Drosophila immigrans]